MATETSSIDELLMGSTGVQTPEAQDQLEADTHDFGEDVTPESVPLPEPDDEPEHEGGDDEPDQEPEPKQTAPELDDYGNPKTPARTYTEEEVNERINRAIRDRLARGGHGQQPSTQQVQQQAQEGFEYDPDSGDSWQSQLEQFVEHTVTKMSQKQVTQQQQAKEQQAESEFRDRFTQGMDKFPDFRDVVGSQPVTDAMTLALRGIPNAASFIYAASKRHPAELSRISQIPDAYAQMVEMGKLDERMRKKPTTTTAPRPVSRTVDNGTLKTSDKKSGEPSIEDLIAKADAKRRSQFVARRR